MMLRSLWLLGAVACGDVWAPAQQDPTTFPLECGHAQPACASSCHDRERPSSHDPASTQVCADCHLSSCGWDEVDSPHPPGFEEPELHDPASLLQDPAEGACQECHGDDLGGGSASGCDDCHAEAGHADWQTDCTFCHGGSVESSGAPPEDIDGTDDPDAITFRAHTAHAVSGGEYPEVGCSQCHLDFTAALDAEHWFDDTPAVSEVVPGPIDPAFAWEAGSCSGSYCHSDGPRADGEVADDGTSMTCDSCHATADATAMSGLHAVHLAFSEPASCDDCHASTMDGDTVVVPELHVDGVIDVETTCSGGACHGLDHEHNNDGW